MANRKCSVTVVTHCAVLPVVLTGLVPRFSSRN